MGKIQDRINNKADDIAMQFYGKSYFELDQPDKERVMDLARLSVDIDLALVARVNINKIMGTGLVHLNERGG